jgi:hypothetical protein
MTKTKSLNTKEYSLTTEEVQNLKGREKFTSYILDLVQRDIAIYMSQVVYKRLGLTPDTNAKLSEDSTKLIVDTSPKIIMP